MDDLLFEAASNGDLDQAKKALADGAHVEYRYKGLTPLLKAAKYGFPEIVSVLIDHDADVNAVTDYVPETPLMLATRFRKNPFENYLATVKLLVANGADVNASAFANESCRTPLINAAGDPAHHEIVAFLLESGADVDAKPCFDETAIMDAAWLGVAETVSLLVQYGADIHATNYHGETVIHFATRNFNPKVLTLLVHLGVDIDSKTDWGSTALMHKAFSTAPDAEPTLRLLLSLGASTDIQSKNGKTALIYAVDSKSEKKVLALLEYGANVSIKDQDGKTALAYALDLPDSDLKNRIIAALRSHGAHQ